MEFEYYDQLNYVVGNSNFAKVRKIHLILEKVEHLRIQLIPQEENSITDNFAKSVCIRSLGLRLFNARKKLPCGWIKGGEIILIYSKTKSSQFYIF